MRSNATGFIGIFLSIYLLISPESSAQKFAHSASPVTGFLENKGQFVDQDYNPRADVRYLYAADGFKVQLRRNGFSFEALRYERQALDTRILPHPTADNRDQDMVYTTLVSSHRIDIECVGAQPSPEILHYGKSSAYWNYVLPNGSVEGITGIRAYSTVVYKDIYPNIDLVFESGEEENSSIPVKYSFVVRPGGKVSDIRLKYRGADYVRLEDGALVIGTANGSIAEAAPVSFVTQLQSVDVSSDISGTRVESGYILDDNELRFSVGSYDSNQTLVIDPSIEWCTYYGGGSGDRGYGIGIYPNGDVAITGRTSSWNNIITSGAFQISYSSDDGYVAKFSSGGTLLWGTYYGGRSLDTGRDIDIDSNGDVVVAGIMSSSGFGTPGTHQEHPGGLWDGYVAKFSSTGTRLWHSYFGGGSTEWVGFGMTLDNSNNIIVVGRTESSNDIATVGVHQTTRGGSEDAYIAKFKPNGTLSWATYYGGSGNDYALDAICDSIGSIYLTGETSSTSGITTVGGFQTTFGGNRDSYLAKFSRYGILLWATYIGGNVQESGFDVAIAGSNILVTGETLSTNNIASTTAYQSSLAGGSDAYLAMFDPNGKRLWSTYFGGSGDDRGNAMHAVGRKIFFTGISRSPSGIATAGAIQPTNSGGGDVFYTEFDDAGNRQYGTYFGGSSQDIGYDITFDGSSHLYVVGETGSGGLGTSGIHQPLKQSGTDAFILKIGVDISTAIQANAGPDTIICAGTFAQLHASASWGRPPYQFSWQPTTGLSNPNIANPIATPTVTTRYVVTVRDNLGTSDTDTMTVFVETVPSLTIQGPTVICLNQEFEYKVQGQNGYLYTWDAQPGVIVNGQGSNAVRVRWNGSSGRLMVFYTSSAGCSDTAFLYVTSDTIVLHGRRTVCVNDTAAYWVDVTGGSSYTWNVSGGTILPGTNQDRIVVRWKVPGTGTVTVVVTDNNGCVLRTELHQVHVVDAVDVDISGPVSLCSADTASYFLRDSQGAQYNWTIIGGTITGGQGSNRVTVQWSPTNNGQIRVHVSNPAGCDGYDTLAVTVDYLPVLQISGPTLICDSLIAEYSVQDLDSIVYDWSVSGGALLSGQGTNVIRARWSDTIGRVKLVYRTQNGCTDSTWLDVNNPEAVVTGNTTLCEGDIADYIVSGVTGIQYKWSVQGGTIVSGDNSPKLSVRWTEPGLKSIQVVVTDAGGCTWTSQLLTVTVSSAPLLQVSGRNRVCRNDTAAYRANKVAGATYSWIVGGGTIISGENTSAIVVKWTAASSGTVRLELANAAGCTSDTTITVSIVDAPNPQITGTEYICISDTATYSISSTITGTIVWTVTNGTIISGQGEHAITVDLLSVDATDIIVTVTNSLGCTGSDTLHVTRYDTPTIIGPVTLCRGEQANYSVGQYPGFTIKWQITGGSIISSSSTSIVSVMWGTDSIGTLRVTLSDGKGCVLEQEITVLLGTLPNAEILGPTVLCKNEFAEYQMDTNEPYSFIWQVTGGTIRYGQGAPSVGIDWGNTGSGTLSLTVTTKDGCSVTIVKDITLSGIDSLKISGPTSVCIESEGLYSIDSSITGSIVWTLTNGTIVSGQGTHRIVVLWGTEISGRVEVVVTDMNGCVSSAILEPITVSESPSPEISGPRKFCPGAEVAFSVNFQNNASIRWSSPNGLFTSGTNLWTMTAIWNTPGIDSVIVIVNYGSGCVGRTAIAVEVVEADSVSISGPVTVCPGSEAMYYISSSQSGAASWLVTGGSLLTGNGKDSISIRWGSSDTGTLEVQFTDSLGCLHYSLPFTVTIGDSLTPVISGPLQLCTDSIAVYTAQPQGAAQYIWYIQGATLINNDGAGTIEVRWDGPTPHEISVFVEDESGCSGTSKVLEIEILELPALIINGPLIACIGNIETYTTDLIAGLQYKWNTVGGSIQSGQGTNSVAILWERTGVGTVILEISNALGCVLRLPLVAVDVRDRSSQASITVRGDTLISSPGITYQWFRWGIAIPGATEQIYIPTEDGDYLVIVTDPNGCTSASSIVDYVACVAFAVVEIPHLVATPGERILIPIYLKSSACLDLYNVDSCSFDLRFADDILSPDMDGPEMQRAMTQGMRVLGIKIKRSSSELLANVPVYVMLGSSDTTSIVIENFRWLQRDVPTELSHGFLRVEVCEEGGKRLFDDTQTFMLNQNHPNPFNSTTVIQYVLIESAWTTLEVFDIYGRKAAVLVDAYMEAGEHRAVFQADDLPSGSYYYVLSTPSLKKFMLMRLLK